MAGAVRSQTGGCLIKVWLGEKKKVIPFLHFEKEDLDGYSAKC